MTTDSFWEPIFQRAIDDPDTIALIAADTSDRALSELIRPNPALMRLAMPCLKGRDVVQRDRLVQLFLRYAEKEESLRRVLLYRWVRDNPATLVYPTIPADEASAKRLSAGEFGSPLKVRILSRLDPRESAKEWYRLVLADFSLDAPASNGNTPKPGDGRKEIPVFEKNEKNEKSGETGETGESEKNEENKKIEENETAKTLKRLQVELAEARSEARDLRKRLKESEAARSAADRLLSTGSEERRRLEERVEEGHRQAGLLRREVAEIRVQVGEIFTDAKRREKAAKEKNENSCSPEDAEATQPTETTKVAKDLERITVLEELLRRRNASIERLEQELSRCRMDEQTKSAAEEARDRLQEKLGLVEAALAGLRGGSLFRLLLREAEGTERGFRALLEGSGGERLLLPPEIRPPKGAVEGEWLWLARNPRGEPRELFAPEAPLRRELTGILRWREQGGIFENDDGVLPVFAPIDERNDGLPVTATVLPVFFERPEGVWGLRFHEAPATVSSPPVLSFEMLRKRLGLVQIDEQRLLEFVREKGISCEVLDTGLRPLSNGIAFISELRRILPVCIVCERPECRRAAAGNPFLRNTRSNEPCSVCFEETGESPSLQQENRSAVYDFGGAQILIVGGDAVGPHYRAAFARHRLAVSWISGFDNLGALRSGLGGMKLALVVLKQTSHTLLRELLPTARRSGVRVAFSQKRGVSGVLAKLVEILKPAAR
ncbi:MAG: hypothetical protein WA705_30465 [Candidatus Ozemobacteraceae bacterium]